MEIYVFGLGHIGLPMADWISLSGNHVNGIDVNSKVIKDISEGLVHIEEYYNSISISSLTKNLIENNQLSISTIFKRKDINPSVFIITVGIADKDDGLKDISPINQVLDTIIPELLPEDLIIFRTTLIPGTCENIIAPRIKNLNFPVYLAYCPETLMETHAFDELQNNPMILSALDDISYEKAFYFLRSLTTAPIKKASNMRTAELSKIIQNIYRDVNIALANEISEVTPLLNVDTYELNSLVNTHPRVDLLSPGLGVGGYCLPNALPYLEYSFSDKKKCLLPLIRTARQLNEQRPQKIVEIIKTALKDNNKNLPNSVIAVIGLAMKDFCADCRLSPSLALIKLLQLEGAKVCAYDPKVPINYAFQLSSIEKCVKTADCIVIAANQDGIKLSLESFIRSTSNKIPLVDTRNIFNKLEIVNLYKI